MVIFAIGDVHGRADLLHRLIEKIESEAASTDSTVVAVVLGDILDRGPDSRAVVDMLLDWRSCGGAKVTIIKGNHEEAALDFLHDAQTGATWVEYGGGETLRSYGVDVPTRRTDAEAWERARDAFEAALPRAHIDLLAKLRTSVEFGDYVFVHAGLRPGVPIAEQSERDLLWIRDEFLRSSAAWERVVVHGHTPKAVPHSDDRRIGVDTGAYASGVLTAVRLEGTNRTFVQA